MPQHSAGLLVFDDSSGGLRVFLAHMSGPFWAHKDAGAWSIPKGLYDPDHEHPQDAALREFVEEVGAPAPEGQLIDLGAVRQRSGKVVHAYAVRGDARLAFVASNVFTMEWPPRSGRQQEFPEVDGARWFDANDARGKLVPGQVPLLDALVAALSAPPV